MQNLPPCFYRISGKALITNEEGKFLLIKESNNFWDFPGGGLDEGESIQTCIQRELQEEMSLETLWIDEIPSYFLTAKSLSEKPIANIFYRVNVKNFDFVASDECQEIRFFSRKEVENSSVFPNVREFIKIYNPEKNVHF